MTWELMKLSECLISCRAQTPHSDCLQPSAQPQSFLSHRYLTTKQFSSYMNIPRGHRRDSMEL